MDILPGESEWFDETLAQASPDVLREMVVRMAQMMMDAEVEQRCGAGYGEVSEQRVNSRNGYRRREWDTRAGTVELAIPRLRTGSYYPDWLLERQRRAERALASVVATSYLLGVSTRRVEKLAEQLGVTKLSKSQVSVPGACSPSPPSPTARRVDGRVRRAAPAGSASGSGRPATADRV
jgi:transposase-like protein